MYYLLNVDKPEPTDMMTWAQMLEEKSNHLWVTRLKKGKKRVTVSTVFLGLDHSFMAKGPPILFETMIFGLVDEDGYEYQWRYGDYYHAQFGHKEAVQTAVEQM